MLEHDALIYGSDDELLEGTVPFLQEGIAAGHGVVVATAEEKLGAYARALGDDAHRVMLVPDSQVYRSPIGAIRAYHDVLEMFRRQGRSRVRAIGEVAYGNGESGFARWMRYESLAHNAFEKSALHVVCPYDARTLPVALLDHARRTHPRLHGPAGPVQSVGFQVPEEVLMSYPEGMGSQMEDPPDVELAITTETLGEARRRLAAALAGALPGRADDAMLAIAEVMANGLRHGTGEVRARLWVRDGALVCSVGNQGPQIADPFFGFRPPVERASGGMGGWIARQLADELSVAAGETGPTVTLQFDR